MGVLYEAVPLTDYRYQFPNYFSYADKTDFFQLTAGPPSTFV